MSEDPFISNINKIMHEKIDKYWRECSLVLALAVVMDPRFKMKLVEFSFTKTYGDDAHEYIKIVEDGIHELFNEYVALPLPLTPAYAEEGSAGSQGRMETSPGGTLLSENGLTDFDAYIMETTSQQMRSELDQYLEESLLPRVPDFDVLGWWKLNKIKYPTLSKMARDILSVPVSTVQPDSVFYTKNKEMDHYRSSLRPETVEALVCAKDWMQYGEAEGSNALVNIVF
ncbi:putative HAT dimerization domain, ribonuclease H-like domain, hAT-like transposase, RNase-H [Lupinus albus]|uniref:Putative HAT dimerization domain, ribonuclease H-like domain, hAT-like transposase, RNase-H n=1 Tax=Lupinus albus TaxID=3870 RepID=A0A6A4PAB9_LUPAL|nr:putative HAT dimerization domain, ribonuclease H-like domain, hAT-like transposase, RNase-H [Lupinus albus]